VAGASAATHHLGLDLGGTNIKWVVAEDTDGAWATLDRGRVPTEADEGPDAVVGRLAGVAVDAVARWPGIGSVGVGVPGEYDPRSGAIRQLTNLLGEWPGKPVASVISATVGLPAHLINDARAFGVAELRLGAGRGVASMIGLALGTGVGGVVAIDGRVHQGHDGTAGEVGHQTIDMDTDAPLCGCGNHGCLEAFVRADRIAAACGTNTVEEAVRRARAGDAVAAAGIAQAGRYLGIGIANVVAVFTPDRVVIGGGVGAALDLFIGPIREQLTLRVQLTPLDQVEIVPAELGIWAGAIGAAIHGAETS